MILRYFLILIFITSFYSCIDEPVIEPTPLPYSTVRVANFSDNVSTIEVTIDGEQSFTLNKGVVTNHFDLVSGKRNFIVKNTENSETIFDLDLTITSYEEVDVIFTGYSEPGNDFNNTFSNLSYTNGFVYLYEDPGTDSTVKMRLFNFISDTPELASIDIQVECFNISDETSETTEAFAFNEVAGLRVPEGQKNFIIFNDSGTDTLSTYTSETLEPGFEHYFYITGPAESPTVNYNRMAPLEVRDK